MVTQPDIRAAYCSLIFTPDLTFCNMYQLYDSIKYWKSTTSDLKKDLVFANILFNFNPWQQALNVKLAYFQVWENLLICDNKPHVQKDLETLMQLETDIIDNDENLMTSFLITRPTG